MAVKVTAFNYSLPRYHVSHVASWTTRCDHMTSQPYCWTFVPSLPSLYLAIRSSHCTRRTILTRLCQGVKGSEYEVRSVTGLTAFTIYCPTSAGCGTCSHRAFPCSSHDPTMSNLSRASTLLPRRSVETGVICATTSWPVFLSPSVPDSRVLRASNVLIQEA